MGRYKGEFVAQFLGDGRRVKLVRPFGYIDDAKLAWSVPKAAIVDGASIPKVLWSITGGPLEGEYRDASVIHDYFCDRRSRPWKAVHRVFYEAMMTSGVNPLKARAMYAGVLLGGPRWSETVVHNNNFSTSNFDNSDSVEPQSEAPGDPPSLRVTTYRMSVSQEAVKALYDRAETEDLSLADIEAIVGEASATLEQKVISIEDRG